MTERLKIFLEEYGFEVTAAKGMGFVSVPDGANTQAILHKLGAEAYAAGKYEEGAKLFEDISASDDYVEFLTLPAYQAID